MKLQIAKNTVNHGRHGDFFRSAEKINGSHQFTSREEDSLGRVIGTVQYIAWVRWCCPRSVMHVMCHASNPTRTKLALNTSDSAITGFLSFIVNLIVPHAYQAYQESTWRWKKHLTSVSCCRCLIISRPESEYLIIAVRVRYPFAVPSAPVPKSICNWGRLRKKGFKKKRCGSWLVDNRLRLGLSRRQYCNRYSSTLPALDYSNSSSAKF